MRQAEKIFSSVKNKVLAVGTSQFYHGDARDCQGSRVTYVGDSCVGLEVSVVRRSPCGKLKNPAPLKSENSHWPFCGSLNRQGDDRRRLMKETCFEVSERLHRTRSLQK